jgi:hypothetical protein
MAYDDYLTVKSSLRLQLVTSTYDFCAGFQLAFTISWISNRKKVDGLCSDDGYTEYCTVKFNSLVHHGAQVLIRIGHLVIGTYENMINVFLQMIFYVGLSFVAQMICFRELRNAINI